MPRPFTNHKRRAGTRPGIRFLSGCGKFEGEDVTSLVAYAMDSTEVCSNEAWGNSATLVEGPFGKDYLSQEFDEVGRLNRAERRFIRQQAGCIVHESTQGFVSVEWFYDSQRLFKRWDAVQGTYHEDDAGDADEEC